MEAMGTRELAEVARLVEVTSDAVALCAADGTILHVNGQLLALTGRDRSALVGTDAKDLLFTTTFERAISHGLPFPLDGTETTLMLKLADGSFIPVLARALSIDGSACAGGEGGEGDAPVRAIAALRSLEDDYARDRRTQRLLSELQAANRRLSGTLSVIMATVGSDDMPTLLDTVLNRMAETLDAAGTTIYFSESGGFKLRGVSEGLEDSFVPEFIPYGAGVPTYVLREQRACRLSIVPPSERNGGAPAFYDLDERTNHRLRLQDTPPFKTLIAVPVFFGTQVLGIVELGWARPCTPRVYDVRVLEVVCDYLSIELVGLVTSLRAARTAELTRSLNRLRELFFSLGEDRAAAWGEMTAEVRRMLSCRLCPVVPDGEDGYAIDFEGGSCVKLPCDIDEAFFSTTAPAARVGSVAAAQPDFMHGETGGDGVADELRSVRLARVDRTTPMGDWLDRHGLPCQGVFVDMGPEAEGLADDSPAVSSAVDGPAPQRMLLLLRDGSQEPVDDIEFDYLTHLARDFELIAGGRRRQESEHRIAQTLQAGMRSSLGSVPGITTDSLYSSATSQALVGGDFYTLVRLPDDRAVMILGDVSGKGVEAASMSALVKTALTAYAWEGASPVKMARSLNSMLMSFSRVETFATAFIAKIDLRAGRASYCSAGHPPTMLLRAGAEEVELLSVQSGVIGAFETMAYESGSFAFEPGDMLFMYTDGAIEARDAGGAFFGEQRLREVLLSGAHRGVTGLCGTVLDALDAFAGGALDDDIALVALRFDVAGELAAGDGHNGPAAASQKEDEAHGGRA